VNIRHLLNILLYNSEIVSLNVIDVFSVRRYILKALSIGDTRP